MTLSRPHPLPAPADAPRIEGMTREEACRELAPRIRAIARRMSSRQHGPVGVDDLASAGALGVLEAFDRFDPARGLPFVSFATIRARGAMLDALRGADPFSRRRRQLARRLSRTAESLRAELGRAPAASEVAERLELPLAEYQAAVSKTLPVVELPLDAPDPAEATPVAEPGPDAEGVLLHREALAVLRAEVDRLPARPRQMVVLYYTEGLSLSEIGQVFGVSLSRVSQILVEARARVMARLDALGGVGRAA